MNRPVTQIRPVFTRTPQERRALSRLRRKTEKAVEQLIAVLDAMMADPDFEDGGDDEAGADEEPSLGWAATVRQEGPHWHGPHRHDVDCERDDSDKEPNLGSSSCVGRCGGGIDGMSGRFTGLTIDHHAWDQTTWAAAGDCGEREIEPEAGDDEACGDVL